jgi:hypothetical protein
MALPLSGGSQTAPNRAPAAKVLAGALANERVANQLIASISGLSTPAAIVAAHTSVTTDFGALQVGDIVVHIPATAGNSSFGVVVTAGTVGVNAQTTGAAVVNDLYLVHRAVNLDGNNPIIPAGGQLTGRTTGDSGTDF